MISVNASVINHSGGIAEKSVIRWSGRFAGMDRYVSGYVERGASETF